MGMEAAMNGGVDVEAAMSKGTSVEAAAREKLHFASDYMEGAHPRLLQALIDTNMESVGGYGNDRFCDAARTRILAACNCPQGAVYFLGGGTQTNQVALDALLRPWQGVVAATSGHVNVHEAGAIEYSGHKVIALPETQGKLDAQSVRTCRESWEADANWEHVVEPGAVYISQPTEYGTLYSLSELEELSALCHEKQMPLYVDGARLAYALACPENDVSLPDLARLSDAFYIGGTKCGALCGEALVFPHPEIAPRFFTQVKQHGALFAKGRLLGVQFGALFEDDFYLEIGRPAIEAADKLREALAEEGFEMPYPAPTNQVFFLADEKTLEQLDAAVEYGFMEAWSDGRQLVRFATSWSTTPEAADELVALIHTLRN